MPSVKINVTYWVILPPAGLIGLKLDATPKVCDVQILIANYFKRSRSWGREEHSCRTAEWFNVLHRAP
jgi:hypothetical protein